LLWRAAEDCGEAGGQAQPISPWQPTSAPEMEALRFTSDPMAAAVSRPPSFAPGMWQA
jgi:hypothetical protein